MKTLCIVPCGNRKIWDVNPDTGPTRAESVYIGTFAKKCREYALKYHPSSWCILSAKYGFLLPDDIVPASYNVSFSKKKTNPITKEELCTQVKEKDLDGYEKIVVIGSKSYVEIIKDVFPEKDIHNPLYGCKGIGYMMGKLTDSIKSGIPLVDVASDVASPIVAKGYEKYLMPITQKLSTHIKKLNVGKYLELMREKIIRQSSCSKLHNLANALRIFEFPFDETEIPLNGIYLLFENGEFAHGGSRIVRVGTHTGHNQLRARLKQHFVIENKDRSIFRKNIGLSILNMVNDPYIDEWKLDYTPRIPRNEYSTVDSSEKRKAVERAVTNYIQNNVSFVVIEIEDKESRLEMESKIISTISLCRECAPSPNWLGLLSPKEKIRTSGLWQVNELYKQPLSEEDFERLREHAGIEKDNLISMIIKNKIKREIGINTKRFTAVTRGTKYVWDYDTLREFDIKRQEVESSNIASVGYDADAEILEIEFHSGGIYRYYRVPMEIFEELIEAESCGKYFHSNIRDEYLYRRIQ